MVLVVVHVAVEPVMVLIPSIGSDGALKVLICRVHSGGVIGIYHETLRHLAMIFDAFDILLKHL